ncbi:MAG: hypothetical protein ACYTG7_18410 [Planctomycetota bacterium]
MGLAPPAALGVFFRLFNLSDQIMAGDELHAPRAALQMPLIENLYRYMWNDNCQPLTALYHLWLDWQGSLSEGIIRFPVLVAGLASLVLIPWLVKWMAGIRPALFIAWFMAASPLLVFYSRIARSYMPVALLAFCAIAAFYAWWTRAAKPAWLLGAAYVLPGVGAIYFHLLAAPIVLTPFLFALGSLIFARQESTSRGLVALAGLGIAVILAMALFLVPGWESLHEIISQKSAGEGINSITLLGNCFLMAGNVHLGMAALFWLLGLAGWIVLLRTRRRLAIYLTVLLIGHFGAVLLLSPAAASAPAIFNRYILVTLPFFYLFNAVALGSAFAMSKGWQGKLLKAAGVIVLAAHILSGPLVDSPLWRTCFAHHKDFLLFYGPQAGIPPERVPAFYKDLEGEGDILEFPWPSMWQKGRLFYVYQEVHGRSVVVSPFLWSLQDPKLRFRNMCRADPQAFLASRADYVVVHLDLPSESKRLSGGLHMPFAPNETQTMRKEAARIANRLGKEWGEPCFQDDAIRAWDMKKVRNP